MKRILVIAAGIFGLLALAESPISTSGGGVIRGYVTGIDGGPMPVNPAGNSGLISEILVVAYDGGLTADGGPFVAPSLCTTLNALPARRSIGIQNCGANDLTCTLGAVCPRPGSAIMIPAKANGVCGFFAMDLSSVTPVQCITMVANQTADAGTIEIELRP